MLQIKRCTAALNGLALAAMGLALSVQAHEPDARVSCTSGPTATSTSTSTSTSILGSALGLLKKDRDDLSIVGLTADNRLVCFSERRPGKARDIGFVSLTTDTKLVGIDFRVQDGKLYGLGDKGGVYSLDTATATATLVNRLSVPLDGTAFGVDFNPAADRLRIVSNTGQNLRHNVNAGGLTLVDSPVNNAGVVAVGVAAAAYTNNDLDAATGTTLLVLDSALDQVSLQSPPNAGALVSTGKLGIDVGLASGFDIYSEVVSGAAVGQQAFATAALPDGKVALYHVNLLTGKATARGTLGTVLPVTDIAIPLNQE